MQFKYSELYKSKIFLNAYKTQKNAGKKLFKTNPDREPFFWIVHHSERIYAVFMVKGPERWFAKSKVR